MGGAFESLGRFFWLMPSIFYFEEIKVYLDPVSSFMPTHIGAETDLRFVYCAGEN